MKKSIGFVLLICAFATCQESQSPSQRKQSLRDVGARITNEEAERWRLRYETSPSTARLQATPIISKSTLEQVLNVAQEYDGIYFQHALEGDKHHVLLIPYEDGRSLWATTMVLHANSDAEIDIATASLWAGRYMSEHPEGPWSHFFGRHIFDTILANSGFESMEISPAINDAGALQLLLYVTYGAATANGRTQGQVEVYDQSNQCPPFCAAQ